MSEEAEVLFSRDGGAGIITLNRPRALNALTLDMVRRIYLQLDTWTKDEAVKLVIIEGTGEKAFCAGGDIRALHDWGRAGDPRAVDFYREEYRLNAFIKHYPKPYVALMDGIDMGGGVGLSVHGSLRIATEKLVFAMPETGIGLFPDVGGTYFLPRCPGEIGTYLALTGERLKAADTIYAGIADIFVGSLHLPELKRRLVSGQDVREMAEPAGAAPLAVRRPDIDRHFSKNSVPEILTSLNSDGSDWALKTVTTIESKSPLSTLIAFRQMREGKSLKFDDALRLEFRLASRFMRGHDFFEGVRAVVIEKDQKPQWQPAALDHVSKEEVNSYFLDLGPEELTFD
jgi:enoyl-CoA hydratase